MKTNQKGFTLIELLIVIAIISLLATTLLPSLSGARAKGDDARRKVTLKSLQSQIALQTDTGVAGYSNIFSTNGDTKAKLDELVSQTGVAGSDYDARSDATSYAVVFPLKANPSKYWCIDASGVSKEVSGRLASSGTPSCGNIVVSGGGGGSSPVITLNTIAGQTTEYYFNHDCQGGISPGYSEPGYDANDAEDGDLTSSVSITPVITAPEGEAVAIPGGYLTYSVTDSDDNVTNVNRTVNVYHTYASCQNNGGGDEEILLGPPGIMCDYAAPPFSCTYVPGPNYNPATHCGMELSCGGGGEESISR